MSKDKTTPPAGTTRKRSTAAPKTKLDPSTSEAVLRHWLEDVPNDRLAHLIKDAARGLTRSLQRHLSDHAVSFGHWSFLRILWENDGLTQRELAVRAGLMEPTAFSALVAMEKLGYVKRVPAPEGEGRKMFVHLTPAGRALKDVLVPLAEDVNAVAVAGVSEEDVAITRQTLLAIIRNLAVDEIEAARADRRILSTREMARLIEQAESGR